MSEAARPLRMRTLRQLAKKLAALGRDEDEAALHNYEAAVRTYYRSGRHDPQIEATIQDLRTTQRELYEARL